MEDHSIAAISAIGVARRRLLNDYPFHARFTAQWALTESPEVMTIGVAIRAGSVHLLFNPDFVMECSIAELGGVLLHEVHHLLFRHLWMSPADYPDEHARVVAQEVTANEFIKGPLPRQPVTLAQYPQLPPNEETSVRYRRLVRQQADHEPAHTLDDHSVWTEAGASPITSGAIIKVAVEDTISSMSIEQIQAIDEDTISSIADLVAGDRAGSAIERILRVRERSTEIPWRHLLREFVRQGAEQHPTFKRPPRRFPAMLGIVPARVHRPSRAPVLLVVDTSGSISSRALSLIASELEVIGTTNDVIVVECDAQIHRVYPFTSGLTNVQGRGGTDLRPALEDAFLAKHSPAAVIYCTDGYGPAPTRPPRVPVLWCLTADGVRPAAWGREVRLPR